MPDEPGRDLPDPDDPEAPGELGRGEKQPGHTAGAPWPAATEHGDGPERPVRVVPTAPDPAGDDQADEDDTEDDTEDDEENDDA